MAESLDRPMKFGKYEGKTVKEVIDLGEEGINWINWVSDNTTRRFVGEVWDLINEIKEKEINQKLEDVFVEVANREMIEFSIDLFRKSHPKLLKAIIQSMKLVKERQI